MMARPHHYQFAHQFLPAHFFADVSQFSKLMQMDGKVFLHYLWTTTGEELEESERLPYGLKLETRKHDKFSIQLISLPKPEFAKEAFYILLASDGRKHFYYTLELHADVEDSTAHAVHHEWTADGVHHNHGKLGSNDFELFVRKSLARIK